MRKMMFILVGLILFLGAAGGFAMRYLDVGNKPSFSTRSAERAPSFRSDRSSRPRPQPNSGNGLTFERIIDILNLAVGVVGIWMAISGMRMQRQAMAMHAQRRDDR